MVTCVLEADFFIDAWTRAICVHFGTTAFVLAPVGAALFSLRESPRRRLKVGAAVAVLSATAVPLFFHNLRQRQGPEEISWMAAFLCSTFGFHFFFKSMAAAFGSFPDGADTDLKTWLVWFTSLPEPVFAKGKMKVADASKLMKQFLLCVSKMLGTSIMLTVMLGGPERGRPFGPGEMLGGWASLSLLNGAAGLWFLYFFASFCLDFSTLSTSLAFRCECRDGFRNPLLASRSLREAWGERWDLPVQLFLKRSVYVPSRKAGISPGTAVILTFFVSGLLHEYTFSIHNYVAYKPGLATVFFTLMGLLMIAEKYLSEKCPQSVLRCFRVLPTPIVATFLMIVSAIPFERLFIHSWIESGGLESVGEMVPHLRCKTIE